MCKGSALWEQQYACDLRGCRSQRTGFALTEEVILGHSPCSDKGLNKSKWIFNLPSSWYNTLTHIKKQIQILRENAWFSLLTSSQWVKWAFDFNQSACFSFLVLENQEFTFNKSVLKIINYFPICLTQIQCSLKFWILFLIMMADFSGANVLLQWTQLKDLTSRIRI